jgi:hypothetical protein
MNGVSTGLVTGKDAQEVRGTSSSPSQEEGLANDSTWGSVDGESTLGDGAGDKSQNGFSVEAELHAERVVRWGGHNVIAH